MITVELFCGTKSFSKVAQALGHDTFTVDIEAKFNPTLVKDILDLKRSDLPKKIDILWASPPCTTFSVASLRHYWDNGKPKNEKTLLGIAIVKKTLELIEEVKKDNHNLIWFIENPRGMLRKQDFMINLPRKTITYCQYGMEYQKATDIWTNCETWKPKPMCSPKSPCHIRAPRGSTYGVQGVRKEKAGLHPDSRYSMSRSAVLRGVIPEKLFYHIFEELKKHDNA